MSKNKYFSILQKFLGNLRRLGEGWKKAQIHEFGVAMLTNHGLGKLLLERSETSDGGANILVDTFSR